LIPVPAGAGLRRTFNGSKWHGLHPAPHGVPCWQFSELREHGGLLSCEPGLGGYRHYGDRTGSQGGSRWNSDSPEHNRWWCDCGSTVIVGWTGSYATLDEAIGGKLGPVSSLAAHPCTSNCHGAIRKASPDNGYLSGRHVLRDGTGRVAFGRLFRRLPRFSRQTRRWFWVPQRLFTRRLTFVPSRITRGTLNGAYYSGATGSSLQITMPS